MLLLDNMWIIFALVSAITTATRDPIIKKLLVAQTSPYIVGGIQFLIAGAILSTVSFVNGFPNVQSGFYSAVSVTVVLNVVATIFLYKALKSGDLSLVSPLLSFTPAFLIVTSFVILHELPSLLGVFGIALIVVGSYILHWAFFGESIVNVFSRFRSDPASMYMLAVAFIFSISGNFDKLASLHGTPVFASAIIDISLGTSLLVLGLLLKKRAGDVAYSGTIRWQWLVLLGMLFALGTWAQNTALTIQIVPYVMAVARLNIIFSVLYGFFLFREHNILWRFVGSMVMLLGIALIVL